MRTAHGSEVDPGGDALAHAVGDAVGAVAAALGDAVEALHLLLRRHDLTQAQHARVQRRLDAAVGLDRRQLRPRHLLALRANAPEVQNLHIQDGKRRTNGVDINSPSPA